MADANPREGAFLARALLAAIAHDHIQPPELKALSHHDDMRGLIIAMGAELDRRQQKIAASDMPRACEAGQDLPYCEPTARYEALDDAISEQHAYVVIEECERLLEEWWHMGVRLSSCIRRATQGSTAV